LKPPQKWPSADLSSYPLRTYSLVLEQLPVTALSAMHRRDTGSLLTLTPRRDRRHGRAMVLFASLSQLETVLDEPGHARHDPSAGPFAADVEERSLEVTIANLMEVQLGLTLLRKCGSKVFSAE